MTNQPFSPISSLYLYPTYTNPQAYKAGTGKDAPVFNPARPPKCWLDPEAAKSPRRNVVYDNVLVLGPEGQVLKGLDGKPSTEPLVLTREEASTVNIFVDNTGFLPPTDPPVPVPMRKLKSTEDLVFSLEGVAIQNLDYQDPNAFGFTPADRRMLEAIVAKLGI